MNINLDRITGKVVLSHSPLTFGVSVEDSFNPSKTIQVQDGEKQKVNDQGQPLYYAMEELQDDTDSYLNQTETETTEARTAVKFEEKEVINKWTDEEGKEHSETVLVKEPVGWIDNDPVIIPNIVNKTITFAENPSEFDVHEILQEKYQSLLDSSSYDYILADVFLNEDDIDINDKDHAANTGVAIMQLLPNGQAKTKLITLANSSSYFELLEIEGSGVDIYINDVKLVSNKATLATATDTLVIRFVNNTNKAVDVRSYAIAY